jgi:hypothetical protein
MERMESIRRSISVWTGELTTPDNVGYNVIKVFGKDSTLSIFRNNKFNLECKY